MKSNNPVWAAYFETNADGEESDSKPLRDYLDPHWSFASFKDIVVIVSIGESHVSPICEEHSIV